MAATIDEIVLGDATTSYAEYGGYRALEKARAMTPEQITEELLASLARVCLPLEDSTVVLSGHGPQTTIGQERATNPYLRQVAAGGRESGTSGAPRRGM